MPIRTLFVANRGEIAVRIIRAAKALGIRTVQTVSAADNEMLAARLADAVADVGQPTPPSHISTRRPLLRPPLRAVPMLSIRATASYRRVPTSPQGGKAQGLFSSGQGRKRSALWATSRWRARWRRARAFRQ